MLPSNFTTKDIDRFWSKVSIADDSDSCWEWQACRDRKGYGIISIGSKTDGTNTVARAHRLAYLLAFETDPNSLHVLHKCDNPSCCNPKHLFLGTPQDNTSDMIKKGRQAKGEKSGQAKLTEAQVREIRKRYRSGNIFQRELAKEYGVTTSLISAIIRRSKRKYVD